MMSGLSQIDQTPPVLRKANIKDFMDCYIYLFIL